MPGSDVLPNLFDMTHSTYASKQTQRQKIPPQARRKRGRAGVAQRTGRVRPLLGKGRPKGGENGEEKKIANSCFTTLGIKPNVADMTKEMRDQLRRERETHISQSLEHRRKADAITVLLGDAPQQVEKEICDPSGEVTVSDLFQIRANELIQRLTPYPDLIKEILKREPSRIFSVRELAEEIARRKGREYTRSFYTSIFVTCQRLVEAGDIKEITLPDGRGFVHKS
jgi:hypothetical protein